MNPFLEQPDAWHDFHQAFIPALRAELNAQLFPRYVVKLEERLYVHELEGEAARFLGRSDVSLSDQAVQLPYVGTATISAPAQGRVLSEVDFEKLSFIEIRDRTARDVVTVIELLSPTNKLPGPDRQQYLAKRNQYLHSRVHLVELDLLRGGPRMPVEGLASCDYCILVSRWETRPQVGLWPLHLRESLPQLPVPLAGNDPPVEIDLQALFQRVFDSAGYAAYIYASDPQPPLNDADRAWASQVLATGSTPAL